MYVCFSEKIGCVDTIFAYIYTPGGISKFYLKLLITYNTYVHVNNACSRCF